MPYHAFAVTALVYGADAWMNRAELCHRSGLPYRALACVALAC